MPRRTFPDRAKPDQAKPRHTLKYDILFNQFLTFLSINHAMPRLAMPHPTKLCLTAPNAAMKHNTL